MQFSIQKEKQGMDRGRCERHIKVPVCNAYSFYEETFSMAILKHSELE